METKQTEPGCVVFTLPGIPTAADAVDVLRQELAARGHPLWPAAEIEVFPGARESLLLARPASEPRLYISAGALAVLSAYFDMEDY